jgi:flagellar biosynthesis/type III secretory pathway chaperone
MNAATYRKQRMLALLRTHIKGNLYNRTGMKDSILYMRSSADDGYPRDAT